MSGLWQNRARTGEVRIRAHSETLPRADIGTPLPASRTPLRRGFAVLTRIAVILRDLTALCTDGGKNMRVSGDAVLLRAAAQLGLAVQSTHQFGLSENRHHLVGIMSNPIGVLESHALSLRQGLGQIRGEG